MARMNVKQQHIFRPCLGYRRAYSAYCSQATNDSQIVHFFCINNQQIVLSENGRNIWLSAHSCYYYS